VDRALKAAIEMDVDTIQVLISLDHGRVSGLRAGHAAEMNGTQWDARLESTRVHLSLLPQSSV
jgi:hypothetical protein